MPGSQECWEGRAVPEGGRSVGNALAQVWLFIVMPVIGGAIAGALFKSKVLSAD